MIKPQSEINEILNEQERNHITHNIIIIIGKARNSKFSKLPHFNWSLHSVAKRDWKVKTPHYYYNDEMQNKKGKRWSRYITDQQMIKI